MLPRLAFFEADSGSFDELDPEYDRLFEEWLRIQPEEDQLGVGSRRIDIQLDRNSLTDESIKETVARAIGVEYLNYDSFCEFLLQPDPDHLFMKIHVQFDWQGAAELTDEEHNTIENFRDVLLAPLTLCSWGYRLVTWLNIGRMLSSVADQTMVIGDLG